MEEHTVLAEVPLFGPSRAAGQKQALDIVEEEHSTPHWSRAMLVGANVFALPRKREEAPKLLFAVSLTPAGNVGAINDDKHHVIAAGMQVYIPAVLVAHLVAAEDAHQLVCETPGHRRLTDAHPAVEQKSL